MAGDVYQLQAGVVVKGCFKWIYVNIIIFLGYEVSQGVLCCCSRCNVGVIVEYVDFYCSVIGIVEVGVQVVIVLAFIQYFVGINQLVIVYIILVIYVGMKILYGVDDCGLVIGVVCFGSMMDDQVGWIGINGCCIRWVGVIGVLVFVAFKVRLIIGVVDWRMFCNGWGVFCVFQFVCMFGVEKV